MTDQPKQRDVSEFDVQLSGPQRREAMECLGQIYTHGPVWDGDLISKWHRTWLVRQGFVMQKEGFNIITEKGRIAIEGIL